MFKTFFLCPLVLFFSAVSSFAACHAVGPTGAGDGSGSTWSNRMNKLPSKLVRGDIYYLMDGSYGSYSFTTPNSGTNRITVKKAQSYDYGRAADGCSNDISTGWTVSSMGAGQATFSSFDAPVAGISYVTVDGNGTSTAPGCGTAATAKSSAKDCGIKFVTSVGGDGPLDIGLNGGGSNRSNGWTLRYIEGQGSGDAGNGTGSGEENAMWCRGGCDSLSVEHVWWYNSSCNFIKLPWSAGATIHASYFKQNYSASACHGQFYIQEVDSSNVEFSNNVIQDIQGTGMWVLMTSGTTNGMRIYNNSIFRTSGSSRPGFSNGFFSCISSGTKCDNISFIGNSIANYTADYVGSAGIFTQNSGGSASFTFENNIFYNTKNIGFSLGGGSFTENHNSWLNSGSPANGSSDVTVTSGAPNPFVDWPNADFRLVGQNANWGNGLALGAPYNVDAAGNARPGSDGTWNRGAFEYGAGGQAVLPPTPPSGLAATVK
jgi:hypothetical protein